MKNILTLLLTCTTLFLSGCLNFNLGEDDKEELQSLFNGQESDGTITDEQISDLFAGDPIQEGDFSLYYIKDVYPDKVFKLKDKTNADNIVETYFASSATLGLGKSTNASTYQLINDPTELEGTWRAYKQTKGDEKFLIDFKDNDNKFELIVLLVDGAVNWSSKITGAPDFYSEDDAQAELDAIAIATAEAIDAQIQACKDRTDFTQAQIDLCIEKIELCSPENYEANRELCAVDVYNPCDRPDLTEEERKECEDRVALCEPGSATFDSTVCGTFFNPCNDPGFTAAQRAECVFAFENCGPGGDLQGTQECADVFKPCEGLVGEDSVKCEEIEDRCHPNNMKPEDAEYCSLLLDPCNLPGLTNAEKEECRANFAEHNCGDPANFDKPECTVGFDPCHGLEGEELMKCEEREKLCGPGNTNPTPEDIKFCNEILSPCLDSNLTAAQKLECQEFWDRCGPGGTEEGTPACYEVHDPCHNPLDPEAEAACQEQRDRCGPDMKPEDAEYCQSLHDPCAIPGLTPEQINECRENQAFCSDPVNHDKPECGGLVFDPCMNIQDPQEREECVAIREKCGPNMHPEDGPYCNDITNPCKDPGMTDAERQKCNEHHSKCGPGGYNIYAPECVGIFDPCAGLPEPELGECRDREKRCGPDMKPEDADFCRDALNPCIGLEGPELEKCEMDFNNNFDQCGPGNPNPPPECFKKDPCREGASPREQELCSIFMDACGCDMQTGACTGAVDPANEGFCTDGGPDIDPCAPEAPPAGKEICDLMMSTCFDPAPSTPEDEKFCFDYAGGGDDNGGGGPRPYIGPHDLHKVIVELKIGFALKTFTETSVSVSFFDYAAIEEIMKDTTEGDPVLKPQFADVKFANFKPGTQNPDFTEITLPDGKTYRVMEAEPADPNDPNDTGDGPGNVRGGPAIIQGGITLIENRAWELFRGPGPGKIPNVMMGK